MPALPWRLAPLTIPVVGAVAGAVALGGCASGDGQDTAPRPSPTSPSSTPSGSSATATPSPEPSSTVSVPPGVALTDQGSTLSFGDSARVIFESTDSRGTVLRLTVRGVRRAAPADFTGFALDDAYKKKGSYYYARVRIANVGSSDVGGVAVPLWGVNPENTLLPPVSFTTPFEPCASTPLPPTFAPGAHLTTCLVFLSPDRGALEAVSYRPSQAFDAITWTGTVATPSPPQKPKR